MEQELDEAKLNLSHLQSHLDKIALQTIESLSDQIIAVASKLQEQHMREFVLRVYNQTMQQPTCQAMCAKLCKTMILLEAYTSETCDGLCPAQFRFPPHAFVLFVMNKKFKKRNS